MLKADILVKTPKGLEEVASKRIMEIPGLKAISKPYGFSGIVLVQCHNIKKEEALNRILKEVPEAEKALPIYAIARSELNEIITTCAKVACGVVSSNETFAVRTTRRGSHTFTSIDVNVQAGAQIQKVTGAGVDLEVPDKIVWIEILQDTAFISITGREVQWKKLWPGKPYVLPIMRAISIVQMPYLGPFEAAKSIGARIGRAIQTFEISELIIAPKEKISAIEFYAFLSGIFEGISSRYEIQKRSYGREVRKVPVYIQDLYQLVRERAGENLIVTSTRGIPISQAIGKIVEMINEGQVTILVGAREGIPTGIFRFADLVLDLAPGITLPTDYAASSALIALITILDQAKVFPKWKKRRRA